MIDLILKIHLNHLLNFYKKIFLKIKIVKIIKDINYLFKNNKKIIII